EQGHADTTMRSDLRPKGDGARVFAWIIRRLNPQVRIAIGCRVYACSDGLEQPAAAVDATLQLRLLSLRRLLPIDRCGAPIDLGLAAPPHLPNFLADVVPEPTRP